MSEDDFKKTRQTYGLVVRGSIEEIEDLKEKVQESGVDPVYQRTTGVRLRIVKQSRYNHMKKKIENYRERVEELEGNGDD